MTSHLRLTIYFFVQFPEKSSKQFIYEYVFNSLVPKIVLLPCYLAFLFLSINVYGQSSSSSIYNLLITIFPVFFLPTTFCGFSNYLTYFTYFRYLTKKRLRSRRFIEQFCQFLRFWFRFFLPSRFCSTF